METLRVSELLGDGIGPELAESVHAVAEALPLRTEFLRVDLSLENRRRNPDVYDEAEASLRETRIGLKYPTVTAGESPNAVLRRRLGFSVIHRPVLSIRGISSNFKENVALEIVRVATGGTYDDPGQMIGEDVAVALRIVERRPCTEAARFAFEHARRNRLSVTSSSKHTIQRATDGFFETIVREVAASYTDVRHRVELFDALLAKVILKPNDYQVVLVLNEYGDFLSDMAGGLVGSLGTGASGNYAFARAGAIDVAMFDPAGGTAPDIAGKGIANPTAALLAFSMLLDHAEHPELGGALRAAVLGAIAEGRSTADVGGKLDTRAFTAIVADTVARALA
ncbi:MAG TPA: isocitrate/isopropylmalate family dehydrogenase [Myxococcota bacterium]|nr:isocitrate/isopropylmalate family dehydrogenase [Myxococcota bacterium]